MQSLLGLTAEAIASLESHYTQALWDYQFLTPDPGFVNKDLSIVETDPGDILGPTLQGDYRIGYHLSILVAIDPDPRAD